MLFFFLCSAEGWWSSLTPSILLKHILVFKNALAFMLRNGLLVTHNPGVKYLLDAIKLLYKVSAVCVCRFIARFTVVFEFSIKYEKKSVSLG